ncbi:MAG: hypothetical protein LAO03_19245 [Acidobacteriia bacterium]|nr:hypothetical protein [Terriglobia bacterium]
MVDQSRSDVAIYILGAVLGLGAGWLNLVIDDLLLVALLVLASTMLLGALRPERPWRWVILVGACVPAMQLLAYFFLAAKPYRAQIYESFLGFLTGTAGGYAGSAGRKALSEIFGTK